MNIKHFSLAYQKKNSFESRTDSCLARRFDFVFSENKIRSQPFEKSMLLNENLVRIYLDLESTLSSATFFQRHERALYRFSHGLESQG